MSRGALDGKRESNQADKLKADSNKPSGERPRKRDRESVREKRGLRERESERRPALERRGKTSGKQRQFSLVVGMKISYGIQDLKGTPAPPDRIVQC